jgi:hypothetical protein
MRFTRFRADHRQQAACDTTLRAGVKPFEVFPSEIGGCPSPSPKTGSPFTLPLSSFTQLSADLQAGSQSAKRQPQGFDHSQSPLLHRCVAAADLPDTPLGSLFRLRAFARFSQTTANPEGLTAAALGPISLSEERQFGLRCYCLRRNEDRNLQQPPPTPLSSRSEHSRKSEPHVQPDFVDGATCRQAATQPRSSRRKNATADATAFQLNALPHWAVTLETNTALPRCPEHPAEVGCRPLRKRSAVGPEGPRLPFQQAASSNRETSSTLP